MLLTNEYRPDPRVRKEAIGVLKGGFTPTIVAWDRSGVRPRVEVKEGVKVERVRTLKVDGPLAMILNYPLFAVRSYLRSIADGFEVVHANDLDTLPIGVALSWLKQAPLVFDMHEHYSHMVRADLPGWASTLFDWLERLLMPRADLVITASGRRTEQLNREGLSSLITVINAVEVPTFRATNVNRPNGELVLYYGGTLEPMRYIEEIVETVAGVHGIRLVVAGNGRLEGFVRKAAIEHDNIEFRGFLPHQVMMKETSEADVVICLIDPLNLNYVDSMPNKVCEAMALGIPVLTSKGTYAGEVVERLGVGMAIDWSEKEFLEAIEALRDEKSRQKMGETGRKLAEEKYNWPRMEERLLSGYQSLMRAELPR